MIKLLRVTSLLSAFVLLLLAIGVQAQDDPSGALVIALSNDPTSLYEPNTADSAARNAARPLYDSLVSLNENGEIEPALATSWEVNGDGTDYIFTLREGVTFHNGEAFNAESVIATWRFGQAETNQDTDVYRDAISVAALDDLTVRITTPEPNPIFLTHLATGWWAIPPQYMAEVGIEGFEQAPVGTGPFRFVERIAADRIVYEANPNYWNSDQPGVSQVTFRIIPDESTRLAAIQTGEVDIVNGLTVDQAGLLQADPSVDVIAYASDRVYYVGFKNVNNGQGTPLEDPRVRQALNYAVNRPGIINALFGGEAQLIAGFTLPFNLGYDEAVQPYPYDPEQAQTLLAEAGFADGFGIGMGCPADAYLNINDVCLAIQSDLEAIGVTVDLEIVSTNTFWGQPQYATVGPMFVDSWASSVGEALPRLQGALLPGNYYNGWEDATITEFIAELDATVDRDTRGTLYAELQQYMFENPPFIYLYALNQFAAVNSRVEGYSPRANDDYDLNTVTIAGS